MKVQWRLDRWRAAELGTCGYRSRCTEVQRWAREQGEEVGRQGCIEAGTRECVSLGLVGWEWNRAEAGHAR